MIFNFVVHLNIKTTRTDHDKFLTNSNSSDVVNVNGFYVYLTRRFVVAETHRYSNYYSRSVCFVGQHNMKIKHKRKTAAEPIWRQEPINFVSCASVHPRIFWSTEIFITAKNTIDTSMYWWIKFLISFSITMYTINIPSLNIMTFWLFFT